MGMASSKQAEIMQALPNEKKWTLIQQQRLKALENNERVRKIYLIF